MPFSIQTKYAENKYKQGDVVAIRPDGFEYSEGDCLKEWLLAGRSIEKYRYTFAITYCTNPELDGTEVEVQALLEAYGDESALYQRKIFLNVPIDYNNQNRKDLRETGETRATWETIKTLIGVRP